MIDKPELTKTAIVTGACSGMGLALTRHLLSKTNDSGSEQWRVVMADINESGYEAIKASLPQGMHLFVRADVSKWSDQLELFKRTFEWSGGRIDFFANNAGVPDKQPLLRWLGNSEVAQDDDPVEPDLSCIDIDLKAVFYGLMNFVHCTRKTRRLLGRKTVDTLDDVGIDGGDACIGVVAAEDFHPTMVCTASIAGQYPFFILPIYTAAKHGCVGLVRSAAPTLLENEGITFNCIMPGTVKTDIIPKPVLAQWPEEYFTSMETIVRAFDELIDGKGGVVQDGVSDGQDGQQKNGCCVECSANRLFYREAVPFPDPVQEWVTAQSKKEGILGRHMQQVMIAQ